MQLKQEKIIVEPGGEAIVVPELGVDTVVKIQADQTSGAFSIVEAVLQPGAFVPPHRHERTDEVSYILEGELGVMVAEEDFRAGPGSFVVRPKGVPHALWNVGDRPVKVLDIYTPAGFEAYFAEARRLLSITPPLSLAQLAGAALAYDVFFLPEQTPRLMEKYGLKLPGVD